MTTAHLAHSIEVVVTPGASAFYAGETFSCTITFKNLAPAPAAAQATSRAPSLGKSLGHSSKGHRSAVSLTSDTYGLEQRVPSNASVVSLGRDLPARKGLIGKDAEGGSPVLARKDLLGAQTNGLYGSKRLPSDIGHKRASYSIALSSPDLLADLSAQNVAYDQRRLSSGPPKTPQKRSGVLPPLIVEEAPTPTLDGGSPTRDRSTISPTESPSHLRSKSLIETQTDALVDAFQDVGVDDPSPRPSVDFYRQGQNESIDAVWRDRVTDLTHGRRSGSGRTISRLSSSTSSIPTFPYAPSSATLSRFPSLGTSYPASAPAWDPRFPQKGTQLLLWTFAQLQGTFEVDESMVKPAEFVAVKRALFGGDYRHAPRAATAGLVGGGSLSVDDADPTGLGWREWFWGNDRDYTDRRGVSTLEQRRMRAMNDKSVPTLSMPPSILAVDLALEPGESKTYEYSLPLPADLPPSFRGKAIRFNYTLLVGSNRAPDQLAGETQQTSRLVRVPIRLYNNVAFSGARPFYDLTNPIVWYRDEALTSSPDDPKIVTRRRRKSTGRFELEAYASRLLSTAFSHPSLNQNGFVPPVDTPSVAYAPFSPPLAYDNPATRPEMRTRTTSHGTIEAPPEAEPGEEAVGGCKGAVEIVSRNSQQASYEINKDGFAVATLVLVKTAFRLGETVHGVILLNSGPARVLRLAARLESCELIETSISTKPAHLVREATRRTQAEHHEITLDTARVAIALPIPSGSTPDFSTSGVKLQWSVRLSFLVVPPPPATDSAIADQARPRHGRQQSALSSTSNLNAPHSRQHSRSRSLAALGTPSALAQAEITDPIAVSSGLHHLLPASPVPTAGHTSYKAVPDLSYQPVLYRSGDRPQGGPGEPGATVLVPTRVDVVECSIPVKMYPSSTAYRPGISHFLL